MRDCPRGHTGRYGFAGELVGVTGQEEGFWVMGKLDPAAWTPSRELGDELVWMSRAL